MISDTERRFSGLSSKFFLRDCENCNLRIHWILLPKNFLNKNHVFLYLRLNIQRIAFGHFSKKFRPGSQNSFLRVQMNILKQNFFHEKIIRFLSFCDIEQKLSAFARTFFGEVVKIAFYVIIGTLCCSIFFSEGNIVFLNIFGH